ncbi:methyltransferase domain-containing protein [Veillonella sp.]|nr:methyltransferase domain-containing protein [Veillonella sp.]MDU3600708.1 methyltransferase domain-containing protein [Veillonella sp.]
MLIANALHIMPKPDEAMKEIYRVLKPNGTLLPPLFYGKRESKEK